MKLVAKLKLLPTPLQGEALLATMERFNAACNWLAGKAFESKLADKIKLQQEHYRELRESFGLSAQMAVRAISKVIEVYKRDKSILPTFRIHGSIPYDQRILSFKPDDSVTILTLAGRTLIPFVLGVYHRTRMLGSRGQTDLILRKGRWYLNVTVEVPDQTPIKPAEFLGVDLGIRNLATDSDGVRYSGDEVEKVRTRLLDLRTALQSNGSRSARRHLKKLAGKEARFRADINHVISKRLVAKAKDTNRGIALEDRNRSRPCRLKTTWRRAAARESRSCTAWRRGPARGSPGCCGLGTSTF